ncbi:3-hydroxyisobutyrate dehydrogenase [Nakamurella sp. YIM 132087]|uniref:3-hydroxyisobutyrate dehydrogenase n=1 Tax=Nakamurella alba TaxID=2665158 RepID=A0A7K1FLD7_9ACTN|nr:3-hydroxyisobutyrate dehydrogenase [Nakamurella alba]MTD14916.1 3-hydroxyisobutyrate dehydrogenase [Nakamurella alba]
MAACRDVTRTTSAAAPGSRRTCSARSATSMDIGWIGLGNMGGPMTANLVAAGHRVIGFDLSEAAKAAAADNGVVVVDSVAAAVAGADIVFTMLPAGGHARQVILGEGGVLASAASTTLVVDSSTIDIATARELHAGAAAAGFAFLDAPVSGGVSGAAAGTLTFMIGGEDAVLDRARPVIEVLAGRIFHCGGPGSGQAAKITNNMMLGITLQATCEGAVLAERLGLDSKVFQQLAAVSSGDSWALRTWYPVEGVVETAAVNRDFEGGFSAALLRKDLGLALQAGEETGTDLSFAQAVADRLETIDAHGWSGKDCSVLVKLVDR